MSVSVYALKYKNEIVYYGTTNNIKRREKEHQWEGEIIFDEAERVSTCKTRQKARKKEKELLATHRQQHGRNPKYNKDSDG